MFYEKGHNHHDWQYFMKMFLSPMPCWRQRLFRATLMLSNANQKQCQWLWNLLSNINPRKQCFCWLIILHGKVSCQRTLVEHFFDQFMGKNYFILIFQGLQIVGCEFCPKSICKSQQEGKLFHSTVQTCNSLFDTLQSKSLHLAKNGQKTIPLMVLKPL